MVLLLFSCSSEPTVVHLRTVKHANKVNSKVITNCSARVEIKGMSCEMGCGGTIRKALKATKAVGRVSFDFEEGREVQIAKVEYDSTRLNTQEMESIISKLNEGQFEINNLQVVK